MGRRGPVSQPAHLRVLRGNPGKRKSPEQAAKVPPGRPECPYWLNDAAREEWDRIVPELDNLGLISKVDLAILAAYCSTWAHVVEAEEAVRLEGLTAQGQHGTVRSAHWVVLKDARAQLVTLARELFLTPTSRLRATVKPQDEDEQAAYAREILD